VLEALFSDTTQPVGDKKAISTLAAASEIDTPDDVPPAQSLEMCILISPSNSSNYLYCVRYPGTTAYYCVEITCMKPDSFRSLCSAKKLARRARHALGLAWISYWTPTLAACWTPTSTRSAR
jgi:hypothetical protein